MFTEERLFLSVCASVKLMHHLKQEITRIEKVILEKIKLRNEFEGLLTLPGVGPIIALTIMLEVGDINRLTEVGNYSSYCRCVKSTRTRKSPSEFATEMRLAAAVKWYEMGMISQDFNRQVIRSTRHTVKFLSLTLL